MRVSLIGIRDARLMPPAYVKPFVKRQKNDAADAEAICEALQRPSMRFVPTSIVPQFTALGFIAIMERRRAERERLIGCSGWNRRPRSASGRRTMPVGE